jgi:hypothetical protein
MRISDAVREDVRARTAGRSGEDTRASVPGAGARGPGWGHEAGHWRDRGRRAARRRTPFTFDAQGRVESAGDDPWLRLSRQLTGWLDSSFQVPGTRLRFGWEPVIGLVPVVGDAVGAALSSVLLWTAHRLGVPRIVQARMLVNVVYDTLVGSVPVIGDLYDFFFRSNRRNLDLLERALAEPERAGRLSDWLYVGAAGAVAALVLAGLVSLAGAVIGAVLSALPGF